MLFINFFCLCIVNTRTTIGAFLLSRIFCVLGGSHVRFPKVGRVRTHATRVVTALKVHGLRDIELIWMAVPELFDGKEKNKHSCVVQNNSFKDVFVVSRSRLCKFKSLPSIIHWYRKRMK